MFPLPIFFHKNLTQHTHTNTNTHTPFYSPLRFCPELPGQPAPERQNQNVKQIWI